MHARFDSYRFLSLAFATVIALAWLMPARAQDNFELNEETFNQWLFNASQGKYNPDSELALMIDSVDRVCGLNDDQKKRLDLAAHGDFTRFERKVDVLKAEYVGKSYGQNEIGEVYQKIQPLGQLYQAGLLGSDSLFAKVLDSTLNSEQAAKFEQVEAERRKARYRAKVRLFVVTAQRSCALTDDQRRALVDLILAETKPPKIFGQYDWYVILFEASKIPDEKYSAIVDEAQMKPLKQMLQQGAGMQQFLRQQKLLDE